MSRESDLRKLKSWHFAPSILQVGRGYPNDLEGWKNTLSKEMSDIFIRFTCLKTIGLFWGFSHNYHIQTLLVQLKNNKHLGSTWSDSNNTATDWRDVQISGSLGQCLSWMGTNPEKMPNLNIDRFSYFYCANDSTNAIASFSHNPKYWTGAPFEPLLREVSDKLLGWDENTMEERMKFYESL